MGNTRNYATWITPGVLEYFPLLTWNKNAQVEQEGTRLPCSQSSQSCSGSQYQPWPSPYRPPPASSPPPTPPASRSKVPEGQLREERIQKAVTGRACYRARFCFV